MTTKDWIDVASSVSVIIASIAATIIAFIGLKAWRYEFIGKRRLELAEEVLALFYQARDIIADIRNPLGSLGEGETRKPQPKERPEQKKALDGAYVLIERYNRRHDVFAQIQAHRYRFIASFGTTKAKPFDELGRVIHDLMNAAHRMATLSSYPENSWPSEELFEKRQKQTEELDRLIYARTEGDPIRPKVDSLVAEMDRTCRRIIENQKQSHSRIVVLAKALIAALSEAGSVGRRE